MKRSFLSFIVFFVSIFSIFAQAPQAFKYQAIARDGSGNLIAEKELGIRISLLQGNESGAIAYSETHHVKSNEFGLVNLLIGQGQAEKGNFGEVDWGANSYWVKVEMDINGGMDYKLMGSTALYSVPYALYAKQAETLKKPSLIKKATPYIYGRSVNLTNAPTVTPNTRMPATGDSFLNAESGNVGIGTSTPNTKLEVAGGTILCAYSHTSDLLPNLAVYNENGSSSYTPGAATYGILSSVSSDLSDVKMAITVSAQGDDGEKYGIYSNVSGDEGLKYAVYGRASGANNAKYGVYGRAEGNAGVKIGVYGWAFSGEDNKYGVFGLATGSLGEKIGVYGQSSGEGINWAGYFDGRLYVDENVGFGTTTPDQHLEVAGTGNQTVRITSTDHKDVGLEFIRIGTPYVDWRIVDSIGHLYFLYGDDDFATHPTTGYKMHSHTPISHGFMPVEDDVKNLGGPNNRWRYLYLTEGVIIPANPGDMINIRDIDYGLDEILQLNPISYSLKAHPEAEPKLGLQALETEQLIGEAVTKDPVIEVIEEGNFNYTGETDYGINYSTFIPVLIKGMQEQQAMIDELKKDKSDMAAENADILKRIERLEKLVLGD